MPSSSPDKKAADPEDTQTPPTPVESAVNQASALWVRPKSELSEADYHGFYRHLSGDYSNPLAWVHSKVEGTYEYTLLLYVPSRAPYDMWIPQPGRGWPRKRTACSSSRRATRDRPATGKRRMGPSPNGRTRE